MKEKLLCILIVVLLSNLIIAQNSNTGTAQIPPTIRVDPPETKDTSKGVGSTFTVNITISNAENIYGWQVNMTFNPAVVNTTVGSIIEGSFLSDMGFPTTFLRKVYNADGYLLLSCFFTVPFPPDGAYGDGVLVSITFKVREVERGTLLQFVDGTKLYTLVGGNPVQIENFSTEDGIFDNRVGNALPVASFSVLPLASDKRGEVNFDASTSYDPDAWLISYHWDYGDGASEVFMRERLRDVNLTATATHTFTQNGTYNVTLTVKDSDNATAIAIADVTVLFDVAVTQVESPYITVMPGTLVTVNVTVANNGDFLETFNVTAYSNQTNIGTQEVTDLAPQTQKTLTFTWNTTGASLGKYFLKANATGVAGEANIGNNQYIDGFVTVAETNIIDHTVVVGGIAFHVITNSTSTLSAFNFNWAEKKIGFNVTGDVGTGAFCNVTIPMELLNASSPDAWVVKLDGTNITYTATANGTHYFIYFTYTHSGQSAGVEIIGETVATPPVAVFTPSKTKAILGESVSFDASSSYDPDGTVQSWSWDFGDSNIATGETVEHTYAAVGVYNVTLTVTDNKQLTNSSRTAIQIIDYPTANFTYSPLSPLVDETVTFDATASTPNGGSITNYAWEFGDGQTGTGATTTHSYSATGTYNVKLTVTDSEDLTNSTVKTVIVEIHNIAVTLVTASPNTVKIGESVTIQVTVANKGNFTESFAVKAYYNNTEIETKSVTNLAAGNSQMLTITWNTTNVTADVYTVKANASQVAGETKTDDNNYTYGTVAVQKKTSTLSLSALPNTLTRGATTTINGTLDPNRQSVFITIQYRLVDGTWSLFRTLITDAQGKYQFDWAPEKSGTYEIQASWQGDTTTESCQSIVQTVTVKEAQALIPLEYMVIAVAVTILIAVAVYFLRFRGK